MQSLRKPYLEAIRCTLLYVEGMVDFGILYEEGVLCEVVGFCDTNCASDLSICKSTTENVFSLGSRVISWCSKRQLTVSLRTAEAKYTTASNYGSTWMCMPNALRCMETSTRDQSRNQTKWVNKSSFSNSNQDWQHFRSDMKHSQF